MKKRILSIIITLCMVLLLVPTTAYAGGTETNPTELTTSDSTWSTGWYVANGILTIPQRVTVSGHVNLILADGCNLTVSGGIRVEGSNSLTIYGQESGNGILSATCTGGDAGIGGNRGGINGNGGNGGTITINGGIITASGTNGGAGIGGGSRGNTKTVGGSGGKITINGGTVKADGAWNSGGGGAGIGGGYGGGSGGTIVINGGTVTATSNSSGAGIGGGGYGGAGGNITISGGTVKATGGDNGAGLGGGSTGGGGGTITISGGVVEANGRGGGAGIGGGWAGNSGSFKTDNGNAVIFASKGSEAKSHISDTSGKDNSSWSGVIFEGNSGKVYGESVAPSEDFTIPAGKTLTIESGHALVIKQGVTLTNNGDINNSGKIYVDGTFTGTADNLYYPLTLVHATASENTSEHDSKNYGKAGSEITLTPDVLTGYEFTEWSVSPSNAITINSNSKFTMPNRAITVTAQYKDIAEPVISGIEDGKIYCSAQTVTVSDNDAIATVTVNGIKVTLDEYNKFTLTPASGEQKIIAIDNAGNSKTVAVTVNDGHSYGEWQSNGDGTHRHRCTVDGCDGYEDGDCAGGEATYFKKAVCDTCHEAYGELLTDTAAPTGKISVGINKWNSFLNTITFGIFFEDTQSVTITASDDSYSHDGYTDDKAVKVEYYLYSGDTALTKEDLASKTFTVYDDSFNINPDNKYVVYAKLTDHAGNVTYISSNGIVLDATAPVISGVGNGKTYCEAQTVTVTEEYIASVTVNDVAVILDANNQFTLNPAEGTQTIVVTDKAGNETSVTVTVNDGHSYGEWKSNGDGTHRHCCTVDGCDGYEDGDCAGGEATCTSKAVCDTCGEEYGELDSSNHDLINTPAKDATVTEIGNTEYWHCTDCNKYFADEKGTNEISLEDTVIQKLTPEIIKGKGQSVAEGEKKELSFTSNAAYSDFIRVEIDGKTLDVENYTVKEGSTIVTLKADYVATLSAGEHTIGIVSESGTATTTFTVAEKAGAEDSAKTGDNTDLALWLALMLLSGAGITGVTAYSRRKRTNE